MKIKNILMLFLLQIFVIPKSASHYYNEIEGFGFPEYHFNNTCNLLDGLYVGKHLVCDSIIQYIPHSLWNYYNTEFCSGKNIEEFSMHTDFEKKITFANIRLSKSGKGYIDINDSIFSTNPQIKQRDTKYCVDNVDIDSLNHFRLVTLRNEDVKNFYYDVKDSTIYVITNQY